MALLRICSKILKLCKDNEYFELVIVFSFLFLNERTVHFRIGINLVKLYLKKKKVFICI